MLDGKTRNQGGFVSAEHSHRGGFVAIDGGLGDFNSGAIKTGKADDFSLVSVGRKFSYRLIYVGYKHLLHTGCESEGLDKIRPLVPGIVHPGSDQIAGHLGGRERFVQIASTVCGINEDHVAKIPALARDELNWAAVCNFRGLHPGGTQFLMADAYVHLLKNFISPTALANLGGRNDSNIGEEHCRP